MKTIRKKVGLSPGSLIIGHSYVISLQEKEDNIFEPLRERLRKGKGRIRTMGADYLAYAIPENRSGL